MAAKNESRPSPQARIQSGLAVKPHNSNLSIIDDTRDDSGLELRNIIIDDLGILHITADIDEPAFRSIFRL